MTVIDPSPASLLDILTHPDPSENLSEGLLSQLLYKGALLALFQDGSDQAVQALSVASNRCPAEPVQILALELIARLGEKGSTRAVDMLFQEFIATGRKEPAALIDAHGFSTSDPETQAVYSLLTNHLDRYREVDSDFKILTRFYRATTPSIQERILRAAHRFGLDHWALIVTAVLSKSEDDLNLLVESYPTFTAEEKALLLSELIIRNDPVNNLAADAICKIFIRYEDASARDIAMQSGFSPNQPVDRALFYFITDQWDAYERLDFNHNLLAAAYAAADPLLRRRILSLSRNSGHSEWLENLPETHRARWLAEMDDADWQQASAHLISAKRWADIWRLALAAPPVWGVRLLREIEQSGWRPDGQDEADFFQSLLPIVHFCQSQPLKIKPLKHLKLPSGAVTGLAVRSDGKQLAAGTISAGLQIFQLPDGLPANAHITGTVPLVRSLVFSQSGEYLAAACGDDLIRVFSMTEHKAIKVISGHTNIIRALALHPDQRTLFSAGFDGAVIAWRFPQGAEQARLEQSPVEIHAIGVSPDGNRVLTAGANQSIHVWRWPDGLLLHELEGHTGTVTSLAMSPVGSLAASAGADRIVRIWNYNSGKLIHSLDALQQTNVTALVFINDGQTLVAGDDKGKIYFLSTSTGEVLPPSPLNGHTQRMSGLALIPGKDCLASASADGSIAIWPLQTFIWSRSPMAIAHPDLLQSAEKEMTRSYVSQQEIQWLRLIQEILKWRQRFDVEIGDIQPISAGEFDIEL
jgi:hypothetical protein